LRSVFWRSSSSLSCRFIRFLHNFRSFRDTAHKSFDPVKGVNPLKLNCLELPVELLEVFFKDLNPPERFECVKHAVENLWKTRG